VAAQDWAQEPPHLQRNVHAGSLQQRDELAVCGALPIKVAICHVSGHVTHIEAHTLVQSSLLCWQLARGQEVCRRVEAGSWQYSRQGLLKCEWHTLPTDGIVCSQASEQQWRSAGISAGSKPYGKAKGHLEARPACT
jgi:hypothetical protein